MSTSTPFKTQLELFKHLTLGKFAQAIGDKDVIIQFNPDGGLLDIKKQCLLSNMALLYHNNAFQPYTPPPWEDLLVDGTEIWCFVAMQTKDNLTEDRCNSVCKVRSYKYGKYSTVLGKTFNYAKPVTEGFNLDILEELKNVRF